MLYTNTDTWKNSLGLRLFHIKKQKLLFPFQNISITFCFLPFYLAGGFFSSFLIVFYFTDGRRNQLHNSYTISIPHLTDAQLSWSSSREVNLTLKLQEARILRSLFSLICTGKNYSTAKHPCICVFVSMNMHVCKFIKHGRKYKLI